VTVIASELPQSACVPAGSRVVATRIAARGVKHWFIVPFYVLASVSRPRRDEPPN
jgi:hypothetical protein